MSIERRINSLKGRSHESGDAESFLTNLKGEIIQRDRRRQNFRFLLPAMTRAG